MNTKKLTELTTRSMKNCSKTELLEFRKNAAWLAKTALDEEDRSGAAHVLFMIDGEIEQRSVRC